MVCVTGRLTMRDWTDRDGNKRRSAEVVANHIYFCEKKQTNDWTAMAQNAPDIDGELPFN